MNVPLLLGTIKKSTKPRGTTKALAVSLALICVNFMGLVAEVEVNRVREIGADATR